MARSNGLQLSSDFRLMDAKHDTRQTADHCCSLFTRGRAILWTLVLCFNWWVDAERDRYKFAKLLSRH